MLTYERTFDVIVVGAGHAGCEAALAAARMGATVLTVTQNIDRTGWMPCNPAIGGLGKGHLVKEIDALGGVMARAIDATGIHFRQLNTRKGPAVRASRAQADKWAYAAEVRLAMESQPGLTLKQASVTDLLVEDESAEGQGPSRAVIRGVATDLGIRYLGATVVLTTGTFMRGLCHYGATKVKGGRAGDKASYGLSATLERLGFPLLRLKTGTVPRLDGRTVDFAGLEVQPGDDPPRPFAMYGTEIRMPQVPCHITWTNAGTHDVIRANLGRSPMYTAGDDGIDGIGPRYCPSIEDKVVRFADKTRHQVFLEPEGLKTREIYPNGISTSLPIDVQLALVRTIPGLERVEITRPGYAVEYDCVDPTELGPDLQTRRVRGLFHAGQINGTSGYEEAAIQGLLAGVNAARQVRAEAPVVLERADAYGGVLVDDLVSRGIDEPYRMFTSRAEYRLLLREDNADERLMPLGRELGLVDDAPWAAYLARQDAVRRALEALGEPLRPSGGLTDRLAALDSAPVSRPTTWEELLRRPELSPADLVSLGAPGLEGLDPIAAEKLAIQVKYAGYIARQERQIARFRKLEGVRLPRDLDYAAVHGLTHEARQRLSAIRPANMGQAGRLRGVTPAAVTALMIHLDKIGQRAHQRRTG